jgi:hypothetical protein
MLRTFQFYHTTQHDHHHDARLPARSPQLHDSNSTAAHVLPPQALAAAHKKLRSFFTEKQDFLLRLLVGGVLFDRLPSPL